MRLSNRVVIATCVLLAVIIVGLIINTRVHFLWPAEKWPDFWVATVSGIITLATIGAIATFVVEQIVRNIEEERSKRQFQTDCEKEWEEFKQQLYYRLLEESPFSRDIDYADMAIPHHATVLASLVEIAPLQRWQRGLPSPQPLFTELESFPLYYSIFKRNANWLAFDLRNNIDQFNRNQVTSRHSLDPAVSEKAQQAFCLGLLLEEYEYNKRQSSNITDTKDRSPEDMALEQQANKLVMDELIKTKAAPDMLWKLQLSEAALANLLALYSFVRKNVPDDDLRSYGDSRNQLLEYAEEFFKEVNQDAIWRSIERLMKDNDDIMKKAKKQKMKLSEDDRKTLEDNIVWLDLLRKTMDAARSS